MMIGKKPNIILIVIDALRARNLGCYGYTKPTSPNIDRLTKCGVLFQDAYACATLTDPSFTTIFTGNYPISHGITHHVYGIGKQIDRLNNLYTLPEILGSYGYLTLGIDWLGRWHKRGFDFYSNVIGERKKGGLQKLLNLTVQYATRLKIKRLLERTFLQSVASFMLYPSSSLPYPTADVQTSIALDLLGKYHKRRFFLFIHYWDTHLPYNAPLAYPYKFKEYSRDDFCSKNVTDIIDCACYPMYREWLRRSLKDAANIGEVNAKYDGAISFVDHQIGRLLTFLRECGTLDESLIILTADHGESFGEHGVYFDHIGLYDVNIHVPLVLGYTGFPRKQVNGFVQHVDIVPSILDIVGVPETHVYDGKSLVPLIFSDAEVRSAVFIQEAAYTGQRMAIRTREHKYITALSKHDAICKYCKRMHFPFEELYDLNKDPGETQNIIDKQADIADLYRESLQKLVSDFAAREKQGNHGETAVRFSWSEKEEEEVKRRLRSLGYF